jgi:hypothetical protein
VLRSQFYRKLGLAMAAAGLLVVAGCSNQPTTQAANHPAAPKPVAAPAKVTEPGKQITVPKGTEITATMGQTLISNKTHTGDSFAASLATPVKVGGKTVIPRGAKVTGKVVAVKKHELKVALASVVIHGKSYNLETNSLRPSDKVQAKAKSSTAAAKQKKDNSTLSAKSQLTFKLAKPLAFPVKG